MAIRVPVTFDGDASDLRDDLKRGLKRSIPIFGRFGDDASERFSTRFRQGFTGSLTAALQGAVIRDPRVLAALGASVAAAMIPVGNLAAGSFLLAFGAGIAGLGIAFAAQADEVQSRFSELGSSIADDMRRISQPLEGFLLRLADQLQGAFDAVAPSLERIFASLAQPLGDFTGQLLGSFDGSTLEAINDAFIIVLDSLGPALVSLFDQIGTSVTRMVEAVAARPEIFTNLFVGVLTIIPKLFDFLTFLTELTATIVDTFNTISDAFDNALAGGGGEFGKTIRVVKGVVDALAPVVQKNLVKAFEALKKGFDDIVGTIVSDFLPAFNRFLPVLQPVARFLLELFGDVIVGAIRGFVKVVQGALKIVSGLMNAFVAVVSGDWSGLWDAILQIASGALQAVFGIVQFLWNVSIIGAFRKGIVFLTQGLWVGLWKFLRKNAAKGLGAVSKLFSGAVKGIGKLIGGAVRGYIKLWVNLFKGIIKIVVNGWKVLRSAFGGALRAIVTVVTQSFRAVTGSISRGMAIARDIVRRIWNGVTGIISRGAERIVGAVRSLPRRLRNLGSTFADAGRFIITKFIDGIKGAVGFIAGIATAIGEAVRGVVNDMIDQINNALEFKIPIPKAPDITVNPPNIPHLAHGTDFFRGGLAVVGERGPELVSLPRGSRVTPNSETERLLNGNSTQNVVVNNNFYGPTTSGGRLRELEWTMRYAVRGSNELHGGVPA